MSLPSFATQTITVKRAPLVSDHGSQVRDWTATTDRDETGCSVQPAVGSENRINRDAITTIYVVYAPATADVLDTDRVEVFGTDYDIDGPVRRFLTGVLDHLEIPLKAVSG